MAVERSRSAGAAMVARGGQKAVDLILGQRFRQALAAAGARNPQGGIVGPPAFVEAKR